METYRVVSITDRKGNPRIEGRYPLRVGRMCKKPTPRNGDAMMIEWLAQPDGTPYVGMIVTSMKLFPDKYFDVAIVDPPYGINAPNMAMGTNKSRTKNGYPAESTASRLKRSGQVKEWDSKPPTEEYFKELFRVSKNQIIWGGNYFNLPPTKCFVVWDKVQPWDAFSQAEIAWTSYNLPAKLFRYSNTGGTNSEKRIHPTQKPIALYEYLVGAFKLYSLPDKSCFFAFLAQ